VARHSVNAGITSHPFLFVYGTLMRGLREELQEKVSANFVGEGVIQARLYDLGDFPGARLAGGNSATSVRGELYQLRNPMRAIAILDKYEGCFPSDRRNSLFVRELVTVKFEAGRKRKAWTYLYNRPVDNARLIPSGNYRDRVRARL
jgi:gamma-glutamylcyclotransferase (GGCT)/AIG2-like uncharacterized protein YtfP